MEKKIRKKETQKKEIQKKEAIGKNSLIAAGVFALAVICCLALQKLEVQKQSTTVFVFAVFLISLATEGYIYGILSAFAGMLAVNYAFTYPYYELDFNIPVNLISAVIMITVAILTGTLTTKLKENEAAKAESEKERMRANLLRAISHDLRTPLTTIYGASSTLLENREGLTREQQDSVLESIQEDAEWLMRMVENVLSITRLDEGRIKLIKTPVVLDDLIETVMTKFSARYPEQKVSLDIPDEIVVIPMDGILIEQVLGNILENAMLHARGMTWLSLKVFTLGKQAIFEIADNGCGIPRQRLSSLFTGGYADREERADGRKRNTGIGLSVCATIIKAHGGEISGENRKGGGAVFRFTLDKEEIDDE